MLRQNSAIQPVASDCSSRPSTGSGAERSIGPMLSRPRNPPSKTLSPAASFRLTHQVKFRSSFWKMRSRKTRSRGAVDGEHAQRGPRVDGRVHVAEGPLVGRQLAVGVHVPLAAHQQELVLGELRIEVGDGDALEGQVPRREPRVLPGVADRQHVGGVEVAPLVVAALVATLRRRRPGRVAVEPLLDVVVEPLLGPHHPGQGLADDHRGLVVEVAEQPGVEGVGLRFALVQRRREALVEVARIGREAQTDLGGGARRDGQGVPERPLGPAVADGVGAGDDAVADPVLRVGRRPRGPPQALGVGLVLAGQRRRPAVAGQDHATELGVLGHDRPVLRRQRGPAVVAAPGPRVAEPDRREHVEGGLLRPGVAHRQPDADVVRVRLRVVGGEVPVAVLVEDAGVQQLVLGLQPAAAPVLGGQVGVGELTLGVPVPPRRSGAAP